MINILNLTELRNISETANLRHIFPHCLDSMEKHASYLKAGPGLLAAKLIININPGFSTERSFSAEMISIPSVKTCENSQK